MFEEVRKELSWASKRLRAPDISEKKSSSRYIRAVWMRVGGVCQTNKQNIVAENLGISLATLKRYMSNDGACPYSIQFSMECLSGVGSRGSLYRIECDFVNVLMPFAGAGSVGNVANIVLSESELISIYSISNKFGKKIDNHEVII